VQKRPGNWALFLFRDQYGPSDVILGDIFQKK